MNIIVYQYHSSASPETFAINKSLFHSRHSVIGKATMRFPPFSPSDTTSSRLCQSEEEDDDDNDEGDPKTATTRRSERNKTTRLNIDQ